MFSRIRRYFSAEQFPKQPLIDTGESPTFDNPGAWLKARTNGEMLTFGVGYILAMNQIGEVLRPWITIIDNGEMKPETISLALPEYIRTFLRMYDYSRVPVADLMAWVVGIYANPENAQIQYEDVFQLAKDTYEQQLGREDLEARLVELRKANAIPNEATAPSE